MDASELLERIRKAFVALRGRGASANEPSPGRLCYGRIFESKVDQWFDPRPDISRLAKHVFDLRVREQSTYRCSTSTEELENVSAFELLHNSPNLRKRYMLRIALEDIAAVGIVADDAGAFAETGVQLVDARHTNLVGSSHQFEMLIEKLVAEHENGQEIIRRFWDRQLVAQMRRFLENRDYGPSELAAERCRLKISEMDAKIGRL